MPNDLLSTLPPRDELVRAYRRRDAAYEGLFVTAVRTTGVFCRPTCPVRSPLPKNVDFFATPREALRAGYRPCKRCRPTERSDEPAWMNELVRLVEADPSRRIPDADLRRRGLDPATVRRRFQRRFGLTFQAYVRSRRLGEALTVLRRGESVDRAQGASGFASLSGFREAFGRRFGVTPGGRRGTVECIRLGWIDSPIGPLVAGAIDAGVCFLEFTDRRAIERQLATLGARLALPAAPGRHDHFDRLRAELTAYFNGSLTRFTVPTHAPASPFQEAVWTELKRIPFGRTRSYQELASSVGRPEAVRAVGAANGQNRIAILIPCHRVIGKDGQLVGYGGGLRRKEFLLALERRTAR